MDNITKQEIINLAKKLQCISNKADISINVHTDKYGNIDIHVVECKGKPYGVCIKEKEEKTKIIGTEFVETVLSFIPKEQFNPNIHEFVSNGIDKVI